MVVRVKKLPDYYTNLNLTITKITIPGGYDNSWPDVCIGVLTNQDNNEETWKEEVFKENCINGIKISIV